MKSVFLSLILASTLVSAQDKVDQVKIIKIDAICSNEENLFKMLTKFEERPMLKMVSRRSTGNTENEYNTILFGNSKTQSYTLVEQISEKLYCVIGSGIELGVFSSPQESSLKKKNEDIRSHK